MYLGIPAVVIEIMGDRPHFAMVSIAGVRREVNVEAWCPGIGSSSVSASRWRESRPLTRWRRCSTSSMLGCQSSMNSTGWPDWTSSSCTACRWPCPSRRWSDTATMCR